MKIVMKVPVFVISLLCADATALAQQLTKAELAELVERYKPRLPSLTAEGIESVWRETLQREPWYGRLHAHWMALKDDPDIARTLHDDPSCAETDLSTQDTTFRGHAKQYRCTGEVRALDRPGHMVFHANLNADGLLTSAVVVARIPIPFSAPGIGPDEIAAVRELYSDIISRTDIARAPPGVHLEYSKDLDVLKFAMQFR